MTSLILLVALIGQPPSGSGDSTPLRSKTYVVIVNKGAANASKMYLQGIGETTLQITNRPLPFGTINPSKRISYNEIDNFIVYPAGNTRRAALFGGLGGGLLGGAIGGASYKPCSDCFLDFGRSFNIAIGVSIGMALGFVLGVAIGSIRHRFTINRTKQNFDKTRSMLIGIYGAGAERK